MWALFLPESHGRHKKLLTCVKLTTSFQISNSTYDGTQHDEEETTDTSSNWKKVMEHTVFPAVKKYLKPPKECADNRTFNCVADLPDLYKVFERC